VQKRAGIEPGFGPYIATLTCYRDQNVTVLKIK